MLKAKPRSWRSFTGSVKVMTDQQIAQELDELEARFNASRAEDDEGHGGSPGEWMVERMGELETEQKRRRDV